MLFDYRLASIEVCQIPNGKQNAGEYYLRAMLRNKKFRQEKPKRIAIFKDADPELIEAVRNIYPLGNQFKGLNREIAEAGFDATQAIKQLENYNGDDYLTYHHGKFMIAPLNGMFAMKYNGNIGGHQSGEWVKNPNSNFVKVWTETTVFVMCGNEQEVYVDGKDVTTYLNGWSPLEQVENYKRLLTPLEEVPKELISPIWLARLEELTARDVNPQQQNGGANPNPNPVDDSTLPI